MKVISNIFLANQTKFEWVEMSSLEPCQECCIVKLSCPIKREAFDKSCLYDKCKSIFMLSFSIITLRFYDIFLFNLQHIIWCIHDHIAYT